MSLFDRRTYEAFLASLPAVEIVHQWDNASVGKVGGKIFALQVEGTQETGPALSFKVSDMAFDLLPSVAGIIPAPYLARAKWVQARKGCGLSEDELRNYVAEAHRLVAAKLTRALRAELDLTAWLAGRQTP